MQVVAWVILGLSLLCAGTVEAASNDEIFASAQADYKKSNDAALEEDVRELQANHYILAPYADYWLMLLRLSTASNDAVTDFLEKYADFPFADRVRGEWLKQLGKRQDWDTFFKQYPELRRQDAAVTCYAYQGRALQGDQVALAEAKPLWNVSTDQPDNCDDLFDMMFKARILGEEDVWHRLRLALQDGKISLAKSVVKRLPDYTTAYPKLLDRVYENPQRTLEKRIVSFKSQYGRELNLYAMERVARSQPDLAEDLWGKLDNNFSSEDQRYLWGRLALQAARAHDPRALQWYQRAGDALLDEEQLEWRARAAMRAEDWPALQSAIDAMPPKQQEEPTWRYWKARALKEQRHVAEANAIFVELSRGHGFYALLAEEEMGDVMSAPDSFYKPAEVEIQAVKQLPGIQRALELHRQDLRWESRAEWALAAQQLDDKQLLAAAEVAFREEWYDIAINTAEKTRYTRNFALMYPTPYLDRMMGYIRDNDLDEAWVYGLIRQESRFVSNAKSHVGASGLMQVMPATAKWIAKRLGLGRNYHPGMINQLDTNLQFGTHYLRYTLDRMDGQTLLATAAYNAGPSRPKRWAGPQPLEGAIYAEGIPFTETRDYVKKVMSNAYFYAQRLGSKNLTLKQRLGIVGANGEKIDAVLVKEEDK
ncbi:MAG TPA: transglycosylase SLT domain-containing protein [Methylophilaceae bacterium]|nr:transglycosylase SLT domain-containing protein [Methylophilaceae bacterium]